MSIIKIVYMKLWCMYIIVTILLLLRIEANRINGSNLEYSFSRNDCLNGYYLDITRSNNTYIGNLMINNKINNSCSSYDALMVKSSSNKNITTLLPQLKVSSFITFEFWIGINKSNLINDQNIEIFSIGKIDGTSYNIKILLTKDSSHNYDIGLYFQWADSKGNEQLSDMSYLPTSLLSACSNLCVVHIVCSSQYYTQIINNKNVYFIDTQFTYNGLADSVNSLVSSTLFSPNIWKASYYVNLLPTMGLTSLFYFTLYNRQLSTNEIQQNYMARLPRSSPVVTSFSQYVQENGIVGNHYDNPTYYWSPIPTSELVFIILKAYNFDDEIESPNYIPNKPVSEQMKIKLFNLPSDTLGIFYDSTNHQVLTNNSFLYKDIVTGTYNMRFRPSYGKKSINNSTFVTFSYMGIASNIYQSKTNATVNLIVTPIDYPPVANSIKITSLSRKLSEAIVLNSSSLISGIKIVKFPLNGNIYHVLPNGTSILIPLNSTAVIGKPSSLKYLYTGTESSRLSPMIINKDTFTYRLIDVKGHVSINADCLINITTSLFVDVFVNPMAVQDVQSEIKVSARDESELQRNLTIKIISSTMFGHLYNHKSSTIPLKANDNLNSSLSSTLYAKGVALYYQSSNGYFTYPDTTWDFTVHGTKLSIASENFTFIAITSDGSQSEQATQIVTVQNSNDPTEITFQYPLKWSQSNQIEIHSMADTSSYSNSELTTATITGFNIIDIDRDVDVIKVEVTSTLGGKITLNENYISRLIFNNVDLCFSKAHCCCMGDGYSDSHMVFFAKPSDVKLALNGMKYVSTVIGIDTVNITLYDGDKGQCIDFSNKILQSHGLGSRSLQKGCFVRGTSFTVNVIDSSDNKKQSDIAARQSYALFSIGNVHFTLGILLLIVAGLIFLSCIRSCCIYFFYPKINRNGHKLVYSNWWYLGYCFFMCCFCPPKKGEKIVVKKKKRVFSIWFFIGLWFGLCCLCPPKEEEIEEEMKPKRRHRSNPFDSSDDESDISSNSSVDDDRIIYYDASKLQRTKKNRSINHSKHPETLSLGKCPDNGEELKECNEGAESLSNTILQKSKHSDQSLLFIRPKRSIIFDDMKKSNINNDINSDSPMIDASRSTFIDLEKGVSDVETTINDMKIAKELKPINVVDKVDNVELRISSPSSSTPSSPTKLIKRLSQSSPNNQICSPSLDLNPLSTRLMAMTSSQSTFDSSPNISSSSLSSTFTGSKSDVTFKGSSKTNVKRLIDSRSKFKDRRRKKSIEKSSNVTENISLTSSSYLLSSSSSTTKTQLKSPSISSLTEMGYGY